MRTLSFVRAGILGAITVVAVSGSAWAGEPDRAPDGVNAAEPAPLREHRLARENVLGTSLDLTVVTRDPAAAERCLDRALLVIDEACRIFSTYDPESEISRFHRLDAAGQGEAALSPLLGALLRRTRAWQVRSGGAFDPCIAPLIARWQEAERRGSAPTDAELAPLLAAEPRFAIERVSASPGSTYRVAGDGLVRFDLNAIGKGTIIDLALAAARSGAPEVAGLVLNIGGDIGTWGARPDGAPWEVAIADPANPADNAPALARVIVGAGRAVATSGGYARYRTIDGVRYSHLLDPRTGRPVDHVRSATVSAETAETADVLATILTVLPVEEGLALVEATAGGAGLVVTRDGTLHRSERWAAMERPITPPPDPFGFDEVAAAPFAKWKKDFIVEAKFTLVDSGTSGQGGFKRHYVAVWVEDKRGRVIKVVALWAKQGELDYVKKLNDFWKSWNGSVIDQNEANALGTLSKATRRPGEYSVIWDGTTHFGDPVPQGTYTIHIDINREHGPGNERHTHTAVKLKCGSSKKGGKLPDQPELTGVEIRYYKKKSD